MRANDLFCPPLFWEKAIVLGKNTPCTEPQESAGPSKLVITSNPQNEKLEMAKGS